MVKLISDQCGTVVLATNSTMSNYFHFVYVTCVYNIRYVHCTCPFYLIFKKLKLYWIVILLSMDAYRRLNLHITTQYCNCKTGLVNLTPSGLIVQSWMRFNLHLLQFPHKAGWQPITVFYIYIIKACCKYKRLSWNFWSVQIVGQSCKMTSDHLNKRQTLWEGRRLSQFVSAPQYILLNSFYKNSLYKICRSITKSCQNLNFIPFLIFVNCDQQNAGGFKVYPINVFIWSKRRFYTHKSERLL